MRNLCIVFTLIFVSVYAHAQNSNYDQHEAFAPIFYPAYGDDVRTAAGTPGPAYWQNRADYTINATLDDVNNIITGTGCSRINMASQSPYCNQHRKRLVLKPAT